MSRPKPGLGTKPRPRPLSMSRQRPKTKTNEDKTCRREKDRKDNEKHKDFVRNKDIYMCVKNTYIGTQAGIRR